MFPDKSSMIRRAQTIWWLLVAVPVFYLLTAYIVVTSGAGFGAKPSFTQTVLLAFTVVSAANLGLVALTQTSDSFLRSPVKDPIARAFQIMAVGSVLSEALSIYGLVLTFLSGSLVYSVGFSLVTWVSLIWVRTRFAGNIERLPDQ